MLSQVPRGDSFQVRRNTGLSHRNRRQRTLAIFVPAPYFLECALKNAKISGMPLEMMLP